MSFFSLITFIFIGSVLCCSLGFPMEESEPGMPDFHDHMARAVEEMSDTTESQIAPEVARRDLVNFEIGKNFGGFDFEGIVNQLNKMMKMVREKSGDNPQITEDNKDDFINPDEQDPADDPDDNDGAVWALK